MATTRDILRRLRSVRSTKKITKAMELISSAKMRRAVQAMIATRPYAEQAWEMLIDLAQTSDPSLHPLLDERPNPKKIGVVLIATNRGQVGGFNTQVVNAVHDYVSKVEGSALVDTDIVLMGRKGRTIFVKHGHTVGAEFEKHDAVLRAVDVQPMAQLVINGFISGDYDRVVVAYMDFVSTLVQRPRIRQILPLSAAAFHDGSVGLIDWEERKRIEHQHNADRKKFEYAFEPTPDEVVEALFPRMVEMQIYRAVLESNAAEHAARMVAMKNASESAGDLIDELSLTYNQARQASITQDLTEISAGRAALE